MVVIGIALALAVLAYPALNAVFSLEARSAAKNMAVMYEQLHDEAQLRNVTFRVAYHIEEGYWQVEAGDPRTLIFADHESREEAEESWKDKLSKATAEQSEETIKKPSFQRFNERFFKTKYKLPKGTVFGGVWTPQYEEMVKPRRGGDSKRKNDKDAGPKVAYSYLFASGYVEHTVVFLVDEDDDEDGFTIEVEPLSGKVNLFYEVLEDWDERFDWVPDEAPDLPI
jgi:hypothetical protein